MTGVQTCALPISIGKRTYNTLLTYKNIEEVTEQKEFGCLMTDAGFLIVRRNGKVIISGNCDGDSKNNTKSNLEKYPLKGPGRAAHEKKHNRGKNLQGDGSGRKKVPRGYKAKRLVRTKK